MRPYVQLHVDFVSRHGPVLRVFITMIALNPKRELFLHTAIAILASLGGWVSELNACAIYGSFPKLGDPNINTNILQSLLLRPQKGTPNFEKP